MRHTVIVAWDIGKVANYDARDLLVVDIPSEFRVYYGASGKYCAGIGHESHSCSNCNEQPLVGVRYECKECASKTVSLCMQCYHNDEHKKAHAFAFFAFEGYLLFTSKSSRRCY